MRIASLSIPKLNANRVHFLLFLTGLAPRDRRRLGRVRSCDKLESSVPEAFVSSALSRVSRSDSFFDDRNEFFQVFAGIDLLRGNDELKRVAIFDEDGWQFRVALRVLLMELLPVEEGLLSFDSY